MKCTNCDGKGKTTEYDGLRKFWCDYKCEQCNGSGEVEMTNEEWFCGLSTEKKARFLACEFTVACDDYAYSNNKETWNEKYWLEWLKEEHK